MIVADSSPLIALARIGQLGLLRDLFNTVAVPPAVEHEVGSHPRGFEGERPAWIEVHAIEDPSTIAPFLSQLQRGESEAIALALQVDLEVMIDEADGRAVAMAAGVGVLGTLGLLLLAKQRRLLQTVKPHIAALQAEGFRVSPELVTSILHAAGESE